MNMIQSTKQKYNEIRSTFRNNLENIRKKCTFLIDRKVFWLEKLNKKERKIVFNSELFQTEWSKHRIQNER